jgi:tetratricopeptide (TPR) repeat protein
MMRGELDDSIEMLEASIRLNPSFAQSYHGLGMSLTLVGRYDEAIENLEMVERLSPRDPISWASRVVHALACLLAGDAANGANWARKTLQASARNSGYWPHAVLAASLANLGRPEEARAALAQALRERPGLSLAYIRKTLTTRPPGDLGPYLNGLAEAGLPE